MNNKLNLELAREYYKLAPMASVTNYALLVVTLIFYWGMLPATILLTWVGVNCVGATSFFVAVRLFKRYGTENNAVSWLRLYAYLVLFQEAPWGLIGPISFMIESELYRLLTLFMLGGMGAGAIISRAPVFKIYVISLVSLLTPIIITLALQRSTVTDAMLALVVIYLLFMLAVAKSYSATINRNIRLWLDNEQLVTQLRASHAEVEQANRVLTQEIEHRKEVEVELTKAKERSEQASEAKNRFLATVSHELRTPLNGIMGFADLLLEEKLELRQQHYAGQISKAGHALLRIVNDILDITAIEAGHIHLHKEPFLLRTELEDLVSLLRPMAAQKKLLLELHIEEAVGDGFYGDINRLRQIVSNLLSNALKYTEAGWVSLTVTQSHSSTNEAILRFEIEDTGIGIATDALNTIFENFSRLENFETRRNEGAGLGLPIVEALLHKMEGSLFVNSIPGKGSCFSFELPLVQSGELHKRTRPVQLPDSMLDKWHRFNLLVVDDNEVNRMVLTSFLSKVGIQFTEACSGYEALQQTRSGLFDLVLMDIQMPDISGTEVAKRLREELASVPVLIAATAHAFPEQREAIFEAGFSDLLVKPIGMDDLRRVLTQAYLGSYNERKISVNHG